MQQNNDLMGINRGFSHGSATVHTHATHVDILSGTGYSQASATRCSQPEHFSVKLLAGTPS